MRDTVLDLLTFGLWVLALARVTRLLAVDEVTDFIRVAVYSRWGEDSKAGYFSRCPWCQSIWLGFASCWVVFLLTDLFSWWMYPVVALAASYLVGLMASNLEPDDDAEIEILPD
jgi:hypothetical protein